MTGRSVLSSWPEDLFLRTCWGQQLSMCCKYILKAPPGALSALVQEDPAELEGRCSGLPRSRCHLYLVLSPLFSGVNLAILWGLCRSPHSGNC